MANKVKNKYYNRSHICPHTCGVSPEAKFRQLIKCLRNITWPKGTHTCIIINISHKSCFYKLRVYIVQNLLNNDSSKGEFELDESYFGAKRIRGKRGRGAAGKTPVLCRYEQIVIQCAGY